MPLVKLIKIILLILVLLKTTLVWAWPPTEEQQEKWKKIIQDETSEELEDYVDKLKSLGEDISQWFLIGTNDRDSKYRNLVRASEIGESESVQQLIDNGAELQRYLEKSNISHITPLVAACLGGHISVVRVLLDAGADVNAQAWLFTPLLPVSRAFQIVSARRLIEAGDSPKKLGIPWPGSSDDYSQEEDFSQFASLYYLSKRNIEEDPECWTAPFRQSLMLKMMESRKTNEIKKNLKILIQDYPLNVASVFGHTDIAAELIKRGAHISEVRPLGRATLQQIYPTNKGITESFLQFHASSYWSTFAPELQKRLNQLRLAWPPPEQSLINQGVRLTTLDLPAHISLVDWFGRNITRIEDFMLAPDLIKVGDHKERDKGETHMILLTDTTSNMRTPWREPQTSEDSHNMLKLMAIAVRLGAKVDEVGFYHDAHRELMLNDYNGIHGGTPYRSRKSAEGSISYSPGHGAPVYIWDGKSGFTIRTTTYEEEFARICAEADKGDGCRMKKAGKITRSTPLKQYWGSQEVPSEPVVIENTDKLTLNRRRWDQQPFPYDISIRDYVMEQLLDWHRPELARLTLAALEDHPELKQKAFTEGINLFCLGCGGGEDVRIFHRSMLGQGYDVHVTGIERLQFLCWNGASECNSIKDTTHFLCADAQNSAELIRQNRQKAEGVTIVIAEDFLVQQVLPGPYSGLKVLHQLIQPDIADMVVVGGVHHPLISQRIAENAGWSVQEVPIYHSDAVTPYLVRPELNGSVASVSTPAFVLTRPDQDSELSWLKQRTLRRSTKIIADRNWFSGSQSFKTLDLSMSGIPNNGLKLALEEEMNIITQIDLSYTHLEEGQLDTTINLLLGFPKLVHVMASGFEPWYGAFLEAVESIGRFKLVLRKDNQYRHELPTVDPDTAKLLGQFKAIPNERVYSPSKQTIHAKIPDAPAWTTDIHSGFLSAELLPVYQEQLLKILVNHNIQLQETPTDGLCFFHATAQQLHIHESELRASLYNYIAINQVEIQTQFPQFSGGLFNELADELLQGAWGDAGQAQLIAWVYNRRVLLLYFNSQTGTVLIQTLNPDGTVTQPDTPPHDLSENDIILIHNGQGHWLGGSNIQPEDVLHHTNAQLLPTQDYIPSIRVSLSKLLSLPEPRYSPEIFPKLIALLMTAWQMKFR